MRDTTGLTKQSFPIIPQVLGVWILLVRTIDVYLLLTKKKKRKLGIWGEKQKKKKNKTHLFNLDDSPTEDIHIYKLQENKTKRKINLSLALISSSPHSTEKSLQIFFFVFFVCFFF